jgi:hypothetical protein
VCAKLQRAFVVPVTPEARATKTPKA